MSRTQIEFILSRIGVHLQFNHSRNASLSPLQQLLTTLDWLGKGSQYHGVALSHGINKSTVCRVIHKVANVVIDNLMNDYIRWPENAHNVASDFFRIGGFPQVIGCIDGTMVNIDAPKLNEAHFVNRHGKHAINVMAVCGPNRSIYAINSNWPGSSHDARILRNSMLFQRFESGFRPFPNAIILGDSAYPALDWLVPPLRRNPECLREERFNRAHKATRRVIENCFGKKVKN